MENDMKNILYIWFSHFTLAATHRRKNYSLSLYFNKKRIHLRWPIYWQSKPSLNCWTVVERSKWYMLLHTGSHIVTTNQDNCFYMRSLSQTDQKCAESSTYSQFFYYHPPVKFWYTAGEITKMRCWELDIYLYIERYHPLDNRYGFLSSIDNTKNHVATLTCLEWHSEICCVNR